MGWLWGIGGVIVGAAGCWFVMKNYQKYYDLAKAEMQEEIDKFKQEIEDLKKWIEDKIK